MKLISSGVTPQCDRSYVTSGEWRLASRAGRHMVYSTFLCLLLASGDVLAGQCESSKNCNSTQVCLAMGKTLKCVDTVPRSERFDQVVWGSHVWVTSKKSDRIDLVRTIQRLLLEERLSLAVPVDSRVEARVLDRERAVSSLYEVGSSESLNAFLKLERSWDHLLWKSHLRISTLRDALQCIHLASDQKSEVLCWIDLTRALQTLEQDGETFVRLANLDSSALPGMRGYSAEAFQHFVRVFSRITTTVVGGLVARDSTAWQ